MAHTAKKINFMISDDVREEFEQLIPPGERSKVVNEALRKELLSIKRKRLTEKLLTLKVRGPSVSHKDIVEAERKNRLRDS